MDTMQIEHFFPCPVCDAEISVLLDLSEEASAYIEDCEVCCRPLQIRFAADGGRLQDFGASPA
jgi:transcription elongation factor Elf1